jgi:hypothetical protein
LCGFTTKTPAYAPPKVEEKKAEKNALIEAGY